MLKNLLIEFLKNDFEVVCGVKSSVVVKKGTLTLYIASFLLEKCNTLV